MGQAYKHALSFGCVALFISFIFFSLKSYPVIAKFHLLNEPQLPWLMRRSIKEKLAGKGVIASSGGRSEDNMRFHGKLQLVYNKNSYSIT